MRKLLLLIAVIALLGSVVSCSGDDEPKKRGNGVFTVNPIMINHMVNTVTGEVIGISNTRNKLTVDTGKHIATLIVNYNDGTEHTVTFDDLTATPKKLLFYELRSPSDPTFRGYADVNEGSYRFCYNTPNGIRVISTIDKVFYACTQTTIEYSDSTETTKMDNVRYQFEVDPASLTAVVKVMDIQHAKDVKYFEDITAMSVPVTVTNTGYVLSGQNLKTTAHLATTLDSTGYVHPTTTDYPFKIFNATVDLWNDHMDAHFMMGDDATVTAMGKTYADF